ncbi:dynamin family protein [Streptomyces sp. NPDC051366]|uniref:dynamin family protein n=1 Tax=Streptomyces sp. NPDC051366 TaxID=3365652 RepID=UPI003794593E
MTGDAEHFTYTAVRQARSDLVALAERAGLAADALGLRMRREDLDALRDRVHGDTYRILLLGQGKRGKSTLLNALLGAKVLPALPRPTTAVVISVVWDRDRYVVLGGDTAGPAATLPLDDSGIPRDGEAWNALTIDRKNRHRPNAVEHAEIHWPAELCRHGVVLVDSPGLNQDGGRQHLTLSALKDTDVVIFVIDSDVTVDLTELRYVDDYLRPYGHEDFFVAFTKIDRIGEDERDEQIAYLSDVARDSLGVPAGRVFFVNSLAALRLRSQGPPATPEGAEELATTGVPALEEALEGHLVTERVAVKILAPARQLALTVRALQEELAGQQGVREQDLDEAQERCAAARVRLGQLEQHRDQIRDRIDTGLADIDLQVNAAARRFLLAAADACPGWLDEIRPQNQIGLSPFKAKKQVEALVEEVTGALQAAFQTHFVQWQAEELQPRVTQWLEDLGDRLDDDFRTFTAQADRIRLALTPRTDGAKSVDGADRSATERVAAAAMASLIAGVGAAPIGARFGFKAALPALAPQFALGVAVVVLGGGPLGVLAVQLLGSLVGGALLAERTGRHVAEGVADALAGHLRATVDAEAARLGASVAAELASVKSFACRALDTEIEAIRRQVGLADIDRADKEAAVDDVEREAYERSLRHCAARVEEILSTWNTGFAGETGFAGDTGHTADTRDTLHTAITRATGHAADARSARAAGDTR